MATYGSYKKIRTDQIETESIQDSKIIPGAGKNVGLQWIYNERGLKCHACSSAGSCCEQANGKCCLWTVPAKVSTVTFEIWSGGGGGAGHTCCNNCSFALHGSGGSYAIKTINVTEGDEYTVCAGGSWPCSKSHTCVANMGCRSFVIGNGLNNFCVIGGCGGIMCNGSAWGSRVHQTCGNCGVCGIFGADFGIRGSTGVKFGTSQCRCRGQTTYAGHAPMISVHNASGNGELWCMCGCYVNWPAGGGYTGISVYCNNWAKCCAAGSGQGGSGIVKISYY